MITYASTSSSPSPASSTFSSSIRILSGWFSSGFSSWSLRSSTSSTDTLLDPSLSFPGSDSATSSSVSKVPAPGYNQIWRMVLYGTRQHPLCHGQNSFLLFKLKGYRRAYVHGKWGFLLSCLQISAIFSQHWY